MGVAQAAVWAIALAAALASCSTYGGGKKVQTGSVTARAEPATTEAPSLIAFEAIEDATGLTCSGSYQPLDASRTFDSMVVCDDGRTGTVTGTRSRKPSGTGTLTFSDGKSTRVALSLAPVNANAPTAAVRELPTPDPSLYTR